MVAATFLAWAIGPRRTPTIALLMVLAAAFDPRVVWERLEARP